MIVIHGGVQITPERIAEVAERAVAFQAECLDEPGCVEYQLSWKVGAPDRLRLLEVWPDIEAYQAHTEAEHTIAWTAFISGAAAAPPAFERYEF